MQINEILKQSEDRYKSLKSYRDAGTFVGVDSKSELLAQFSTEYTKDFNFFKFEYSCEEYSISLLSSDKETVFRNSYSGESKLSSIEEGIFSLFAVARSVGNVVPMLIFRHILPQNKRILQMNEPIIRSSSADGYEVAGKWGKSDCRVRINKDGVITRFVLAREIPMEEQIERVKEVDALLESNLQSTMKFQDISEVEQIDYYKIDWT